MFQRIIDDIKDSVGRAARLSVLGAIIGLSCTVTLAFLSAAGFIYLRGRYGAINASLAAAGVFALIAIICGIIFSLTKNVRSAAPTRKTGPKKSVKSPLQAALADPMLVATGLQVVRAIGVKRLIPILAVAGIALGVIAARGKSSGDEASNDADDED